MFCIYVENIFIQRRIYILDCLQLKIYSIGSLLKQMQRFLLMVGALPIPTLLNGN